jgi:hypothetical protein
MLISLSKVVFSKKKTFYKIVFIVEKNPKSNRISLINIDKPNK